MAPPEALCLLEKGRRMTPTLMNLPAMAVCTLFLAACASAPPTGLGQIVEPDLIATQAQRPEAAPPGTCWSQLKEPPVLATVTALVVSTPAKFDSDGQLLEPEVVEENTIKTVIEDGKSTWFERPCADVLTPAFIESLQRALGARALYGGPITGRMDADTRFAVRLFQKPLGLDSGILSVEAGRRLGLIAIPTTARSKTQE